MDGFRIWAYTIWYSLMHTVAGSVWFRVSCRIWFKGHTCDVASERHITHTHAGTHTESLMFAYRDIKAYKIKRPNSVLEHNSFEERNLVV
jgi:hypothetical protein